VPRIYSHISLLLLALLVSCQTVKEPTIFEAVVDGDLPETHDLLNDDRARVDERRDDFTPLHYAARQGKVAIAQALLQNGADVQAANRHGFTPLHAAANANHTRMVSFLLDNGADVNARYNGTQCALHDAIFFGQLPLVRLLVAAGADPNAANRHGWAPVHLAALQDHVEIAGYLAERADKNVRTPQQQTALMVAMSAKRWAVAARLIRAGVDPGLADGDGVTPLHVAALVNHTALAKQLLKAGAPPSAAGLEGTPLDWADDNDVSTLLRAYGGRRAP